MIRLRLPLVIVCALLATLSSASAASLISCESVDQNEGVSIGVRVVMRKRDNRFILKIEPSSPNPWFDSANCVVNKTYQPGRDARPGTTSGRISFNELLDAMDRWLSVNHNVFSGRCGTLKIDSTPQGERGWSTTKDFPYYAELLTSRDAAKLRCQRND